eukprot:m51a1_g9131 hypothetical protein (287) ;mRNA; f:33969-35810
MSIIRRSALRGDEVVPFQCINWPDETIQRRTVSVEYVCGDGVNATIKAQGRTCPVCRIGRCRVEATKPGTRKPSRTVYAYELLVRDTQRRWFHEALVEPLPAAPCAAPPPHPTSPFAVVEASPRAGAPLAPLPLALPTSPFVAGAAQMLPAPGKRPRAFAGAAAEQVEAARRVGAALGRGDFRSAITLVLDVHDLFPHEHLAVMQGIAQAPDSVAALGAIERKVEEECDGFSDIVAALRDGFSAGRMRAGQGRSPASSSSSSSFTALVAPPETPRFLQVPAGFFCQ